MMLLRIRFGSLRFMIPSEEISVNCTLFSYFLPAKSIFCIPDTIWGSTVSVEYLNLALALLVYSVRYPSLFWSTNKCMGILFSFQLLINGLHTLLAYAGMSILYKVRTYIIILCIIIEPEIEPLLPICLLISIGNVRYPLDTSRQAIFKKMF